MATEKE